MVIQDQGVEYLRLKRLESCGLFDVHLSLYNGPHRMGKSQLGLGHQEAEEESTNLCGSSARATILLVRDSDGLQPFAPTRLLSI